MRTNWAGAAKRASRSSKPHLLFPALLLLGAGAGCADRTPPPRYSTLDYLLIDVTTPAGTPLNSIMTVPGISNPQYATMCPYNAGSTFFECPTSTANGGLSQTFSFQLLDSVGTPLDTWMESATSAIRVKRVADGSLVVVNNGSSVVFDSIRVRSDRTLSGLLHGKFSLDAVDTNSTNVVSGDSLIHTTNVVVYSAFEPRQRNVPYSFPLSGTMHSETWNSFVPLSGTATQTIDLTFNGSNVVAWTSTVGGTTKNCTYTYGTTGLPVCP